MSKVKLTVSILLLFVLTEVNAQSDSGSVVVHKDPRIDLLVNKQI